MKPYCLRTFLGLSLLAATAAPAWAADELRDRYQQERAACLQGQSHQDRATCLQEAAAAYQDARRGRLEGAGANHEQNALMRCQALPEGQRADCEGRLTQGSTSGSVEGGGMLYEYRTTEPADAAPGTAAPPASGGGMGGGMAPMR